jgi:dephospho-CoA kinase
VEGPVTVAVTGPFASGKSTLVRLLGELPGTETASADEIVHHLLKNDRHTISRIIERFGEDVRGSDGIDRKALGREVFGDAGALRNLEEILHPLVRSETDRRIEASRACSRRVGARTSTLPWPSRYRRSGGERGLRSGAWTRRRCGQ